nr:hypothetical protein [uncultured Mediterranean phage uvMED]
MAWNSNSLRPPSLDSEMENTIKIIRQTIVDNEVAKVGSVHTIPKHVAHMHVMAGNAEYVQEGATNRAVGVEGSDSEQKKRKKK